MMQSIEEDVAAEMSGWMDGRFSGQCSRFPLFFLQRIHPSRSMMMMMMVMI